MIEELYIQNIGGLEKATITFSENFNVITGESGTGKSSIVKALTLATGRRSSILDLHDKEKEAIVKLTLKINDKDKLIIKRIIYPHSKSKAFLNDKQIPLKKLSQLLQSFIEIQTQFSQLQILDEANHLNILDNYGKKEVLPLKLNLKELYQKAANLNKTIKKLEKLVQSIEEFSNIVSENFNLLKSLDSFMLSETVLMQKISELEAKTKELQKEKQIYSLLFGNEKSIQNILEEIETISLKDTKKQKKLNSLIESFYKNLQDFENTFNIQDQTLTLLNQEIEKLTNIYGLIRTIKRNFFPKKQTDIQKEIKKFLVLTENLPTITKNINKHKQKLKELKKALIKTASELTQVRSKLAKNFSETVTQNLKELGLKDACFEVKLTTGNVITPNGCEKAHFLYSPSKKVEFMPVSKVASGGEISRLLIAIKSALSNEKNPKTLLFDEVETGLGGKSALLVGKKLKELSLRYQVILITHEAVIASMADKHIIVEKKGDKALVKEAKNKEERIRELARMLSGDPTKKEALSHAKKLLQEHLLSD